MSSAAKLTTRILEYRNGIYQGQTKGNKRHGQGILITDDNIIIVSEWKNDMMSGKGFILLGQQQYGFGQFNRGEIEGYFLFRSKNKTLFSQFNLSHPINKMVLLNHKTEKVQTIAHKAPIFQILNQKNMSNNNQNEEEQIFNVLGIRFSCYSIVDYLYKQLCVNNERKHQQISKIDTSGIQQTKSYFKLKSLSNGNILFCFEDQTNPISLGFTLNKNQQLVSCGSYINDKLSGLGCKYQNSIRYEGIFDAGFVNGKGLKFSQGKYSFGQFQNGNLVEALYIDDRSTISEQKLKQFKRLQHLRSIWYQNSYIRKNLIKFKGISQLVFEINSQQQYMYPQTILNMSLNQKQSPNKSSNFAVNQNTYIQGGNKLNNSNLNRSNSKNLALNLLLKRQGDKLQTKSSKQFFVRPNLTNTRNQNQGINNNNYVNINTRTSIDNNNDDKLNKTGDAYFKNPEDDDDDIMVKQTRTYTGLKNLRKFKY